MDGEYVLFYYTVLLSLYLCIIYFSIKIRPYMKINSKCYLNEKFDPTNFKKSKTNKDKRKCTLPRGKSGPGPILLLIMW